MPQAGAEVTLEYFDRLSNWGRWGEDDRLGTINLISPRKVVQAASTVQAGEVVSCGLLLDKRTPATGVGLPMIHYMGASGEKWAGQEQQPGMLQVAHDFVGLTVHGYNYTHLDALCHVFWNGQYYNGHSAAMVSADGAAAELAIDDYRSGIVSRGVLLDFAALRGVSFLEASDVIHIDELQAAEAASGVRIEEGDIVLHNTGQGERRGTPSFNPSTDMPCFHPDILPWIHERGVAIWGGDTAHDPPSARAFFAEAVLPIHQVAQVAMGMPLLDGADTTALAATCARLGRCEFQLTIAPLPIRGATGSPVNPIACF
jgi:kynurenine formamidase